MQTYFVVLTVASIALIFFICKIVGSKDGTNSPEPTQAEKGSYI